MRQARRRARFKLFVADVLRHTPIIRLLALLIALWMTFSAGVYWAERGIPGATIQNYGDALYWGVAAFSTAARYSGFSASR